jgi:hypothetical protein
MKQTRRKFLQQAAVAMAASALGSSVSLSAIQLPTTLISPGCRRSKVKIAKLYLGTPKAHWPTPLLDLKAEMQRYEREFAKMKDEFADVDFFVSELVTSPEQVAQFAERLKDADGILLIHLSMGIGNILREILKFQRPTMLFAAPYSGHECHGLGS